MAKQCGAHLTGFDSGCTACWEADAVDVERKRLEREHQEHLELVRQGRAKAADFTYRHSSSAGCTAHMFSFDAGCAACRATRREADDKQRNVRWYRELEQAEADHRNAASRGRTTAAGAATAVAAGTAVSAGSTWAGLGVIGAGVALLLALLAVVLVASFAVAAVTYTVLYGAVVVVPAALGLAGWLASSPQRRSAQRVWLSRLAGVGVGWSAAAAGTWWALGRQDESTLLFVGAAVGSWAVGYLLFRIVTAVTSQRLVEPGTGAAA